METGLTQVERPVYVNKEVKMRTVTYEEQRVMVSSWCLGVLPVPRMSQAPGPVRPHSNVGKFGKDILSGPLQPRRGLGRQTDDAFMGIGSKSTAAGSEPPRTITLPPCNALTACAALGISSGSSVFKSYLRGDLSG